MTRSEARALLRAEGIDRRAYNLGSQLQDVSWILEFDGGSWKVFYFEQGVRDQEVSFSDESSALEHLVRRVLEDPLTRAKYWKNPQV